MRSHQLPLVRSNKAEVISAKAIAAAAVARAVNLSFRDGAMSVAELVDRVLQEAATAAASSSPQLAQLIAQEIREYLPAHAAVAPAC
jgi:hypothetical protein